MIYLDNAAATQVHPDVLKVMLPYFNEIYANPSAVYSTGRQAAYDIEEARNSLAELLNCHAEEIIFTSGGTESCNLAVKGIASASAKKHIITSQTEHSAVLNSCQELERQGYKVDYLPVDSDGLIDLELLKSLITTDTALVTIMYVNNEIGTIQPVYEIAAICRQLNVPFHTDACQAAGYLELDFSDFDAVTLNSSKIYGPKGAGLLYIKSGIPFQPLFSGGDQEFGFRPGTENVPAVIGFSKALQIAIQKQPTEQSRVLKLRNQLLDLLLTIPDTKLNGSRDRRVANNINLSFEGIEGESAVIRLDQIGLICATGSACSSKNVDPSHVLLAINPSRDNAHSSLRLTLGYYITEKDIPIAYNAIKNTIQDLRAFANM